MMRCLVITGFCLTFIFPKNGFTQISPGPLSEVHKSLEGISNCTKCHDLTKKVSNEKCLACHLDVKAKQEAQKGYHASKEVQEKNCFICHSDHHGLKFEIIHFDKKKFDHKSTGYDLTGTHLNLDCIKCHTSKYIANEEARKKQFTYLGLDDQCVSCHQDVHKKTLSQDCATCHNTTHFKPAVFFNHQKTDFVLKGQHQKIDCIECHKPQPGVSIANKNITFTIERFKQCISCHEDIHQKHFGEDCASCHNLESFQQLKKIDIFNHTITSFPLKGKHIHVDCITCHTNGTKSLSVAFQEFNGKDYSKCTLCHKDIHDNKFGQQCIDCHSVESFKITKSVSNTFNHDLTDFKLEGLHQQVDCKACHTGKLTAALPFNQCNDCHHTAKHEDFFVKNVKLDCNVCHDVNGFIETSYSLADHNKTKFPLEGAHMAIACIDCHKKEDKLIFKDLGMTCVSCHKDIHQGLLKTAFYENQACQKCHTVKAWNELVFNHNLTNWKLEGKHIAQSCVACHLEKKNGPERKIIFELGDLNCEACHKDVHVKQFAVNGTTACLHCHGFEDWKASKFDHQKAAFSLEGAHKNVACDQCHKTIIEKDVSCIQYKFISFRCIDCHL
ncbi:MAG: cytochrome c family protein [Saprospiraceae bacterium]